MSSLKQLRLRGSAWFTPHRKRLAENLFWLAADKGVRIFHSIFIAAVVARYLGPSSYGMLAVAGSFLAILTPLITLGFDRVVVRELIVGDDPCELYWTVFVFRFLLGCVAYCVLALLVISGLIPIDSTTEAVVMLIGCAPLSTLAFDATRLIFQSQVREKWIVWIGNLILAIAAVLKLVLVAKNAGVEGFAAVNAGTVIGTSIGITAIGRKLGLVPHFVRPSFRVFRRLVHECWPLILSGLGIALYMNVDILMLRFLVGQDSVGIYSVAARLSAFWFFIPMALSQTLFPGLTKAHAEDPVIYKNSLVRYLQLNTLAAYATVVVAEIFVPPLISLLFGSQYLESIPCFRLHAVAIFFVFLGVARSQHLNLEKIHIYGMWATVIGVATNVALNFLLIPHLAEYGAAIATVVSFAISAFATSFMFPRIRSFGSLQLATLFNPFSSRS